MPKSDEKTVKIRAYSGLDERQTPKNNLTEAQDNALELVKKKAQLEEEKKKSLEYEKKIEQLQESLRMERMKTGEMAGKLAVLEAKVRELAVLETKAQELVLLDAKVRELNDMLAKCRCRKGLARATTVQSISRRRRENSSAASTSPCLLPRCRPAAG